MNIYVKGAKVQKPAEQHTPEPLNLEPTRSPGVSGSDVVATENDSMLARRNEIADNLDNLRGSDLQDTDGVSVMPRPAQEEDEGATEPGEEEPTERVEAAKAEPAKHKIKVNGREMELTWDEILERAQKVESADQYLQLASESVRNAGKLASPPKEDEPEKVEEDDLALARALQMGSEEDAAKAIRRLRAKPSEVTPDVLPRLVDERLKFLKAVESFQAEYKDYLEIPSLNKRAQEIDAQLAEREPSLPYDQRLKRVGEAVRKEALSVVQKFASPKTDKAARKASVAPVPSAAGRQAPMGDDEGEESTEKTIAEMAKSRGQGRPIAH